MKKIIIALISISFIIYSCQNKPIEITQENRFGQLPKTVSHPADNPSTPDKVQLGKMLFWDPVLSGNKDVACATCHHPSFGYAENIELSLGVGGVGLSEKRSKGELVKRNSPSILNTAFNGITGTHSSNHYDPVNAPMFWDMRAKSLEEQALKPILDTKEMKGDKIPEALLYDSLLVRLKAIPEYNILFEKAFGANQISKTNIGKAIAAFERTLIAKNSRFDRYAAGDTKAMTSFELRGMTNFVSAGCVKCHSGPMFSDYKLHVMGHEDNVKLPESDNGDGKYAFRTPSLRNLKLTAPYMHNGVFKSLEEVLSFYEELSGAGGSRNKKIPTSAMDKIIRPFGMTNDQMPSIVAFLKTLDDENFDKSIPVSVPSKLNPGGNIR
jgi:cytochrome c peroxidase